MRIGEITIQLNLERINIEKKMEKRKIKNLLKNERKRGRKM